MCPLGPATSTLSPLPVGGSPSEEADLVLLTFPEGRALGEGLDLALRVARGHEAPLRIVRPVVLPRQTALEADDPKLMGPHRDALDAAVEAGRGQGVEVEGALRKGHDLASIVAAEASEAPGALVLAPGRPPLGKEGGVTRGSVDSLTEESGSRVVVYGEPAAPADCDRVGVAVAGGPHTPGMAAFAPVLARSWDASVLLFHVRDPDDPDRPREEAEGLLDQVASGFPDDLETERQVVEDDDVIAAVLEEARPTDAWVLGAPTRSRWRHFLYGSRARKVQRDAPSWTFVVHEPEG